MKISSKISKFKNKMAGSKDDNKKWLEEILGDISKGSAVKQLALGTASGWVSGYLTMKVGKVMAIAVGGSIILLQVCQHKGYIKIDWDRIQKQADNVVDRIEKETTGKGPSTVDKLERFVDRTIDKAEHLVASKDKKARGWMDSFLNNGSKKSYELQELHIFVISFAAGVVFGIASG